MLFDPSFVRPLTKEIKAMSSTLKIIPRLFTVLMCFAPCTSFAIPILQGQATNLMAAHETAADSLKFIASQANFPSGSSFTTTGNFGANSWNYNVNGVANSENLSLTYIGSLTGDFGADINLQFPAVLLRGHRRLK